MSKDFEIAYLSMEIGLEDAVPTYSGGLGVLAGDTLRAAADVELPVVGITLLHRKGYLEQSFDRAGRQIARPVKWNPADHLERLDATCEVEIEDRTVVLGAWRYEVRGVSGHVVPVLLLDADRSENAPEDRRLTDSLYGGDDRYRLAQEVVLGIGGRRMLLALGHDPRMHHLNEGHAALLALELLREGREAGARSPAAAIAQVRQRCVFTTHTPVPAGHDRFGLTLAVEIIGKEIGGLLAELPGLTADELNMTEVALALSGFVNGVAERHAEVSREMFPGHEIHAVTNGVHSATWTAPAFRELYDRQIPGWRRENARLREAQAIPLEAIASAHRHAKQDLLDEISRQGQHFDPDTFTIGFARRATAYKRATLLFWDPERLRSIARRFGGLQVVFAGKAHPKDEGGQRLIQEIHEYAQELAPDVRLVYLPNYGMHLGGLVTSGVDVWLNNPRAPMEASGTSGMKAVHNGVPNLSVRDGWWCEGAIPGVTGWVIEPSDGTRELMQFVRKLADRTGKDPTAAQVAARAIAREQAKIQQHLEEVVDREDADQLYRLLSHEVLPMFYFHPQRWQEVMRGAIALAASYFTGQRMVEQYERLAYRLER